MTARFMAAALSLVAAAVAAPTAQAQFHPAVVMSENGWDVLETAEGCYAVVPQYAIFLFGDSDPNARLSWTGGCRDGFINGAGTLINDYTIPATEWGPSARAREEVRANAFTGLFDGAADEASFSSYDYGTDYGSTQSYDGFTPPSGMTWHYGGDVRNPMPRYYRQGCSYYVSGYKDDGSYSVSSEVDYGCQQSDGVALRDKVKASLSSPANYAAAAAPPSSPGYSAPQTPKAPATATSAANAPPGAAKTKKVHNPAMDRTQCVKIIETPNPNAAFGVVGSQRIVNECGEKVEVFWCNVDTECPQDFGNTWTLQASGNGSSWPIDLGVFNYGACKGPNSGGFDKGSKGTSFTCPEWP